ncbi:MAG TPA: hypothetical protein VFT96_12640 [Gemmatimonadaceae bacterium]|jgi:hypothetical protein|nr:hypothetical protein [Gemmatimonadaceae bacterium]
MPKALTVQRTLVTPPERERFFERIRRKREHYASAQCRYWVFEEAGLYGAFLEFFEAPDAETLARAHAASDDRVLDPRRVYHEVELP